MKAAGQPTLSVLLILTEAENAFVGSPGAPWDSVEILC